MLGLLSLVLILSFAVPAGCLPKRDTASTPATDSERIAVLESKVSQLQAKLASLPETDSTDYSGDIAQLQGDIDSLQQELDSILGDVDAMLEAWEEDQATTPAPDGEYVTTRWTPTISLEQTMAGVTIDANSIKWRPTSIRDVDTYSITFNISNSNLDSRQIALVIVFAPSSRDTSIDTSNTGMYSTKTPIIWWDSDFTPSDGVDCRRIEFASDLFTIPAGITSTPYILEMNLDFDLYYAK